MRLDKLSDQQIKDAINLGSIVEEDGIVKSIGHYRSFEIKDEGDINRIKSLVRECTINKITGDNDEFYWDI